MHNTAMASGNDFFRTYVDHLPGGKVIDIGAQDINGSLKTVCSPNMEYVGVDFAAGKGVDVILTNPYKLPFNDNSADVVVSSSCFEHSEFFWMSFLEVIRILKPSGVFYLNAPSNGVFHRFPVDCWRFYPDSGVALARWAQANGNPKLVMLESYTSAQEPNVPPDCKWNDFVAVYLKNSDHIGTFPNRIATTRTDVFNVITHGVGTITNYQFLPQDLR